MKSKTRPANVVLLLRMFPLAMLF